MRKLRNIRKASLLIIVTIAITFTVVYIYKQQVNPYKKNQQLAEEFFYKNLFDEGAIATNPGNVEFVDAYATGYQVLSESQGIWMEYCLLKDDQNNFDKTFNFVDQKMMVNDFISYRYIDKDELFYVTSAIDDFRIIGALFEAERKWGNQLYLDQAIKYAEVMYKSIIQDDNIVDFYDIKYASPGETLTFCYADFKTINSLIQVDESWQLVYDNSLKLVKEGYLGNSFPCFATSYDYATKTYSSQPISMIQSLITAINLANIEQCPEQTLEFIEEKVINKSLFGSYTIEGKPLDKVDSTAVYALAAILGNKTGNKVLEDAAIDVLIQFQVLDKDNELYGGFANTDTKDMFSFDNLNALLAMEMRAKSNK